MKKSSSNKKRGTRGREGQPQRPAPSGSRYPTRDNVYDLQARQKNRRADTPRVHPQEEPHNKRPKRQARVSRVLPMFVFIVVAIYLCGQIASMAVQGEDIETETVSYGSIDTPERYTALIVRNEYVETSDRSGQVAYLYAEGDYISKNSAVCTVSDTGSADQLETLLSEIDEKILESQRQRLDLSVFAEDIERIEGNIQSAVDGYAGGGLKTDVSYMYDLKSRVQGFMTQRNEILMSENVESLTQLNQQKSRYEQQLSDNKSTFRNSESGILALSYDGLEATLTPDTLEGITKAQIGDTKTNYISKAGSVSEGDTLFKIVADNKWYLVCYMPNADVADWSSGDKKILDLDHDDGKITVTAKVESIVLGDNEAKIVFSTYEKMEDFIDDRTLDLSMESTIIEGLKVPNDAIVEKSLIAVPRECITESAGSQGVLLMDGDNTRFIAVTIVTYDEENYYIDRSSSLELGDVISQGTGEEAGTYTVSNLLPKTGVYIANSSAAQFVTVDILDQNQEYAIIRSGSTYGLQVYDRVVSDAKNIQEGQSVY